MRMLGEIQTKTYVGWPKGYGGMADYLHERLTKRPFESQNSLTEVTK